MLRFLVSVLVAEPSRYVLTLDPDPSSSRESLAAASSRGELLAAVHRI
jgi:hypothetical protein